MSSIMYLSLNNDFNGVNNWVYQMYYFNISLSIVNDIIQMCNKYVFNMMNPLQWRK